MTAAARLGLAVVAGLLAAAGPAWAQEACLLAPGSRFGVVAGLAQPELAGGERASGGEAGVEAGTSLERVDVSGAVTYLRSSEGVAHPVIARVRVGRPIIELAGFTLCGAALGGGAFGTGSAYSATNLAGGVALTVGRSIIAGATLLAPYIGVRGLGATTSGEVLGQDVSVSGASVGLEAGLGLAAGRAAGALRITADGFDPGLGPTPYPALGVRLVAAWRF